MTRDLVAIPVTHIPTELVLVPVLEETERAQNKFGSQFMLTDLEWFAVLAEEFGEVAKAITQCEVPPVTGPATHVDVRNELEQTASTALRWLTAMALRKDYS